MELDTFWEQTVWGNKSRDKLNFALSTKRSVPLEGETLPWVDLEHSGKTCYFPLFIRHNPYAAHGDEIFSLVHSMSLFFAVEPKITHGRSGKCICRWTADLYIYIYVCLFVFNYVKYEAYQAIPRSTSLFAVIFCLFTPQMRTVKPAETSLSFSSAFSLSFIYHFHVRKKTGFG